MAVDHRFTDNPAFVLGETAGEHRLERAVDVADAALALTHQARSSLRIFSRDLDRRLYSSEAYRHALSAFARLRPGTEARILVQDPTPAIKRDHRLIGLIQHLSTHIGLRRVAVDWAEEPCAFLVADERGLLWRANGTRYEGTVDFHAGPRAAELARWFDGVWDNSEPDPEFRKLTL